MVSASSGQVISSVSSCFFSMLMCFPEVFVNIEPFDKALVVLGAFGSKISMSSASLSSPHAAQAFASVFSC